MIIESLYPQVYPAEGVAVTWNSVLADLLALQVELKDVCGISFSSEETFQMFDMPDGFCDVQQTVDNIVGIIDSVEVDGKEWKFICDLLLLQSLCAKDVGTFVDNALKLLIDRFEGGERNSTSGISLLDYISIFEDIFQDLLKYSDIETVRKVCFVAYSNCVAKSY